MGAQEKEADSCIDLVEKWVTKEKNLGSR